MATKIRLARVGAKGKPRWRIVVQDERAKKDGKVIEILGIYDPQVKPPEVRIKKERVNWWVGHGAQLSTAVKKLVQRES